MSNQAKSLGTRINTEVATFFHLFAERDARAHLWNYLTSPCFFIYCARLSTRINTEVATFLAPICGLLAASAKIPQGALYFVLAGRLRSNASREIKCACLSLTANLAKHSSDPKGTC
jgi:hypothetical protein